MSNIDKWCDAYAAGLRKACAEYPEEYYYGKDPAAVEGVIVKMTRSIREGKGLTGLNHDGRAFKNACKALGIKHTRKAINAFLAGG